MNSRHFDSSSGDNRNVTLMNWAKAAVGWYTSDWVARNRVCPNCGWESRSVEIIEADLIEMIKHWKMGDTPHGGDNGQED